MRDHRSLHAWQEAKAVVDGTIELSRDSWKPYAAALFSQLQRGTAGVSVSFLGCCKPGKILQLGDEPLFFTTYMFFPLTAYAFFLPLTLFT